MSKSLLEWLEYIEAVHPEDVELGLDRVRTVANTMGLLPPASKTVIVAGTNGKGSTAVFAESILRAGGLTVGTTLSPHIDVFNERIRLDGKSDHNRSTGYGRIWHQGWEVRESRRKKCGWCGGGYRSCNDHGCR